MPSENRSADLNLEDSSVRAQNQERSHSQQRAPASIAKAKEANSGKAFIIPNKEGFSPGDPSTFKIVLPKGKRLYDEEKMMEVATDANIDTYEQTY